MGHIPASLLRPGLRLKEEDPGEAGADIILSSDAPLNEDLDEAGSDMVGGLAERDEVGGGGGASSSSSDPAVVSTYFPETKSFSFANTHSFAIYDS